MKDNIYSISEMQYIIEQNGYDIITDIDYISVIHKDNVNNKLVVPFSLIIAGLENDKDYKSYKFFTKAYNHHKDKETVSSKQITKHSLIMLSNIKYIKTIQYIFKQLQEKQLITINLCN